MNNLAILSLDDFENWNNSRSISMGGTTGVLKSILPYLAAEKIYLMGITSNRLNLYCEIPYKNNIFIVPVVFSPEKSKIPVRISAFYCGRKINMILKKYNINTIYSHSMEILFWVRSGPTILLHLHGSANALEKAKNKFFRNKFFQRIWEYLRKENIKKADRIIAIDSLCYGLAKKYSEEKKIILMPNFVNTEIFYEDTTPSRTLEHISEEILLFVGRIEEVKGLELFVDTLLEIHNLKPFKKWKGVFIGRGTYEEIIKKYISAKQVDDMFYFPGPVFEQDELRRIYNRASVLMISSYFEGIPMVILECLACGTHVISTNVGGIKDFIADDKMAFVIEERDHLKFANKIVSISRDMKYDTRKDFKFSADRSAVIINELLNRH